MYNTDVNTEGYSTPEVGIQEEVKFEGVKFENSRLTFNFRQQNGSLVTHSEFEANDKYDVEVQQTDTSRRIKHIAEAVEIDLTVKETDSFEDYSEQVLDTFKTLSNDYTYNVLFIYNKKGFVCLPKYPPFIQRTGEETPLVISSYNKKKLTKVEPDAESESENAPKVNSDLPF